ncbi:MAG TPA: hypothetical protein VK140_14460 [Ktedonobacteraceae bacterium]|nr:hypothetical protein [Ktedonobacteraceae bacterium]
MSNPKAPNVAEASAATTILGGTNRQRSIVVAALASAMPADKNLCKHQAIVWGTQADRRSYIQTGRERVLP